MREIRFRCFYRDKMYPVKEMQFSVDGSYCVSMIEMNLRYVSPDSEHIKGIMQYVGLNDKNGKEIYEDDILSFEDKFTYRVVYHEAKFVCIHGTKSNAIKGLVWGPLHRFFDPDFLVYGGVEVIGNIFEDPDKL